MSHGKQHPQAEAITDTVLAALSENRQVAPFSQTVVDFDLAAAYGVTALLRARRVARGERPVGRKIGFTNRTIWEEYRVFDPIWGDMFDDTVFDIAALSGDFPLSGLAEPRLEPEIVFGLGGAPTPDMDEAALLGCIAWIGHGFEVVQSSFPGWRFAASDVVAGGGLHGALLVGPRSAPGDDRDGWRQALSTFEIELYRDGELVDRGEAANVLDGPLLALRHLCGLLAADSFNPPLAAGEMVTTGTVTRAFPIAAGERWSTRVIGLPLEGIAVTFG